MTAQPEAIAMSDIRAVRQTAFLAYGRHGCREYGEGGN